jgi:hypothetical protein
LHHTSLQWHFSGWHRGKNDLVVHIDPLKTCVHSPRPCTSVLWWAMMLSRWLEPEACRLVFLRANALILVSCGAE